MENGKPDLSPQTPNSTLDNNGITGPVGIESHGDAGTWQVLLLAAALLAIKRLRRLVFNPGNVVAVKDGEAALVLAGPQNRGFADTAGPQ